MAECVPAVVGRRGSERRANLRDRHALRRFLVRMPPVFRRHAVDQRSSAVTSVWLGHDPGSRRLFLGKSKLDLFTFR